MSSLSISDVGGIGDPIPMISIPDVARTGNLARIENNDNDNDNNYNYNYNNTLDGTSQTKRETNLFGSLGLAQRLRLAEQRYVQLEAPHDISVSVTSFSLPPLPAGDFTFNFPTTVPPTVSHPVNTAVPTKVLTTVPTTVKTEVPITVNTTVSVTVDTTVPATVNTKVDKSNLPPFDDEQPSFPYTIYDFTKSSLVVSEISGNDVEEQYHNIMEIVGEACGKCPMCTSDNRVQDLIDTIIDIRFPDLDTALFRDGILSEFGFDDYWNELIVAKPKVRRGYVKYENWYARVWENIEANNDLPSISKVIEKEFGQSRDFRRILAGKQHPECKWRKRELLLFVIRMRRIRGKLEDHPQTQEKQERQTIETTAKKNRKTRDQEKRRKLRDREDKVVAKLLHDTLEELKRVTVETNVRDIMIARRKRMSFVKICPPEGVYSGWEKGSVFLPFINIQEFVSSMKES